jgi:hypothetical protein
LLREIRVVMMRESRLHQEEQYQVGGAAESVDELAREVRGRRLLKCLNQLTWAAATLPPQATRNLTLAPGSRADSTFRPLPFAAQSQSCNCRDTQRASEPGGTYPSGNSAASFQTAPQLVTCPFSSCWPHSSQFWPIRPGLGLSHDQSCHKLCSTLGQRWPGGTAEALGATGSLPRNQ